MEYSNIYEVDGFRLHIHAHSGSLVRVENLSKDRKDINIPLFLSNGVHISRIAYGAFKDAKFGKITIDEDVILCEGAFLYADFETLVWPKINTTIPKYCFYGCTIGNIEGLDAVTDVEEGAFSCAAITFLIWPDNAHEIPVNCFCKSHIGTIINIDNVNEIYPFAFAYAELQSLDLLNSNVVSVGNASFLEVDKSKITKPYYITDNAFDIAFENNQGC